MKQNKFIALVMMVLIVFSSLPTIVVGAEGVHKMFKIKKLEEKIK